MSDSDAQAILLTIKLAALTTIILLVVGPLLAWWLARKNSLVSSLLEAIVALPLVLPPTVLGFYLLMAFSPQHFLGHWYLTLTGSPLTFSFIGLVAASILYSLPFVVQPLQAAFKQFDPSLLEQSKLLQLNGWRLATQVILPATFPSFIVAALLVFAHTVGEFGVVLMIGGNIAGETRVLSIALFDHVETMNYEAAHRLALGLLIFSAAVLVVVYRWSAQTTQKVSCL